jgi:amino acid adenylation domain-containing protein
MTKDENALQWSDREADGLGGEAETVEHFALEPNASPSPANDEWPRDVKTVSALFEQQVAASPSLDALIDADRTLDYATLNRKANKLAHILIERGIGPGAIVALGLPPGEALVVALLAVLKSGACYMPLDPSYPRERLAFMVEDGAPRLVLASAATTEMLSVMCPAGSLLQVDGEQIVDALRDAPSHNPTDREHRRPCSGDDPVYLVYTSGSTGRPKGVLGRQSALVNRLIWIGEACPFAPGERVLNKTSLNFIDGSTELLGALTNGASVVLSSPEMVGDVDRLAATIRMHSIARITVVPSLLAAFLDTCEPKDLRDCRTWVTSGEALSPALARRFRETLPDAVLFNFYGASEAAGDSLYAVCDGENGVPIGFPIRNTGVHVLDDRLTPVETGRSGELYLSGAGLALGYLRQPALTAERFVASPFGPAGTLMYRTGDVVRRRDDGALDFIGRADHQVKIRGVRVEPGEVEAALGNHPDVARCAVVPRTSPAGETQLIAYVAWAEGRGSDASALDAYLGRLLPSAFVPSAFVSLSALPLMPNGKLDRSALPSPQESSTVTGRAPESDAERMVCEVFADILGLERVGADDSFIRLGGHSLLAARAANRLRRLTGADIGLPDIFQHPTAAALAKRLDKRRAAGPALTVRTRPSVLPLSHAQRRLWIHNRLKREDASYHLPYAFRLRGDLDIDALRHALGDVTRRHESLRTVFPQDKEGIPHQRILTPSDSGAAIAVQDIDEADLAPLLEAEAARPFDLTAELPLRAGLFRLGPEDHVLLLTVHHIAMDGASVEPLWSDLAKAYEARRAGRAPDWSPLPVQYADYALWQTEKLGDDAAGDSEIGRQLAYWQDALDGLPERIVLPFEDARSTRKDWQGDVIPLSVHPALHARLLALASEMNASLFMVLQAGLAALLTRLGGGDDIPIGTPAEGRDDDALDALVGLFINMLVLRTDTSGDPSFRSLVERVRSSDLAALAHQDIPFDRLVDALCPDRVAASHPLFQIVLALDLGSRTDFRLDGLASEPLAVKVAASKFDLSFDLREHRQGDHTASGLDGYLEYRTDLFERDVARTLVDRFVAFLEAAVSAPDTHLSDLDLVSADEWSMLRGLSEGPVASVPDADQTIQVCFADRAASHPDKIALRSRGETLNYAELDRRASQVARHLVEIGVGPESCVAILMERSIDLVVATLGVVKAGAAYVPLNVTDPPKRHALVAAETQAKAVIVDTRDQAPEIDAAKVLEFGTIDGPDDPFLVPGHPEQLACILYTSGSTGRPKGIGITHRGVICLALDDCWSDGSQERVLLHSPYAFDASTYELWTPLMRGTELVVAPPGLLETHALATLIRDEGVTAICVTTRLFNLIAAERPATLAPIRSVLIGGEAASPAALRAAIAHCSTTRFVNGYGPAEGTTFVTHQTVRAVGDNDRSVPIGLPRDNTWVRILDERLKPIGIGMVGELYIGGCGVARGYLDRPDITAERFVADPFGPPGARMYRTGDLVRWRADGLLTFVGRADHQAKISGFRIEPGEIETAIAHCDGVGQCAVLIREDRPGDKRVVAYVVGVSGNAPDVGRLRDALADRLPVYMVPSAFVVLDRLPFTSNGKLDRGALPAPDIHGTSEGRGPRNEREATLCTLYSDILGVETVSIDDNFFALGGDSIMSIQLASRARQMGLGFTPGDVFELKTVARLAGAASDVSDEPEESESTHLHVTASDLARVSELVGSDVESVWPLTALQEGLLFHALLDSEAARDVYTVQAVLSLEGRLDPDALRRAAEAVVERHAPLRASFRHRDLSRPVQVIHRRVKLPFEAIDLSGESDAEAALEKVLAEDRRVRFDPEAAPLLRMLLVRLAPERHALVITNHHILLDGWSLPVVIEELMQLYAAYGDAAALPRVTPFERYLGWLDRQDKETARAAWRAALAGLEAPTRLMRAPGRSGGADAAAPPEHVELALDQETTAALEALGRDLDVTLNTIVQGAWGLLVGQLSGQDDVLFGTTVSGRPAELAGVERMVGLFINTVPVRVDLHGGESVAGLLRRLQERQAGLLAHQHLGLTEIQAEAGLGELFDTLLVFENYPASDETQESRSGVCLAGFEVRDETHYPVSLMVVPGERLLLRLDTRGERVGEAQALAERLGHVLAQMAAAPERAVGALPILPAAEREEVLERWNRTDHAVPDGSLTSLIEARAAADPGVTALVAGAERLSYRQLEARANRLAHVLIGLGLGAEDIVALALPRGIDMVVALMAILKSGAAYLPIDPDYPEARIGLMLADARPVLVLSDMATAARLAGALDRPAMRGSETLLLDDPTLTDRLAASPATPPHDIHRRVPFDPRHPAYVIYTSGSTGKPKGVIVTHQGLANFIHAVTEDVGFSAEDRLVSVTTIGFDIAGLELLGSLVAGARVILPDRSVREIDSLRELLWAERATVMQATPSLWRALTTEGGLPQLKVLVGGEALDPDLAAALQEVGPTVNLYGPTETTIWSTRAWLEPDGASVVPIGSPIWNTRAYVLDGSLRPVGVGTPGELYLGGLGLARGYRDQPQLTASRFVADPFGDPGARMYRTGDLVRRRADGELVFLGRNDDQVKIRGHRIEPAEIEQAIASHSDVAQCRVVAGKGLGNERRLIAYVVAKAGRAPETEDLRAHAEAIIPRFMVPSAFVILDSLPLTPNGKLDRKALPVPELAGVRGRPPCTEEEKVLCGLFEEVLGISKVSIDDSFFALGGHSLLATRLVSLLRTRLATGIQLQDVFSRPTVAGLLGASSTQAEADLFGVRLPLRPEGQSAPLFCIHPGYGLSWTYSGLAASIDADIPLYGLQARGFVGDDALPDSLEEMASDYLRHIEEVQPEGPLRLLGWSFGGLVAYEIAGQLQESGREVELLALLDSYPVEQGEPLPDISLAGAQAAFLDMIRYEPASSDPEDVTFAEISEHLRKTDHPLAAISAADLSRMLSIARNNARLAHRFVPGRFEGDLIHFAAAASASSAPDLIDVWSKHVLGTIRQYTIGCDHHAMTAPAALMEIGRILSGTLDEIERRTVSHEKKNARLLWA